MRSAEVTWRFRPHHRRAICGKPGSGCNGNVSTFLEGAVWCRGVECGRGVRLLGVGGSFPNFLACVTLGKVPNLPKPLKKC